MSGYDSNKLKLFAGRKSSAADKFKGPNAYGSFLSPFFLLFFYVQSQSYNE